MRGVCLETSFLPISGWLIDASNALAALLALFTVPLRSSMRASGVLSDVLESVPCILQFLVNIASLYEMVDELNNDKYGGAPNSYWLCILNCLI